MKKAIAIAAVLLVLAAATAFLTGAIPLPGKAATVSLTLEADPAFTKTLTSATADTLAAFEAVRDAGKKSQADQAGMIERAALTATFDDGKTERNTVLAGSDGSLYLLTGKKLLLIDAPAFYEFCDRFGAELYTLRELPTAKIGSSVLPVQDSTYAYRKLDSKSYRTKFETAAPVTIQYDGKSLPVPVIAPEAKSVRAAVSKNGESVWTGAASELKDFAPKTNGSYRVEFAADFDFAAAAGEVVWAYTFEYKAPLGFVVEGSDTFPGEILVLRAYNVPEGETVACETDISFNPTFFDTGRGTMVALLPVSYTTAPGTHTVTLSCAGTSQTFQITEKNKEFDIQNMVISTETADETINSQKANAEYESVIAPLRKVADPVQYWSGRFILPVTGAIVSTTPGTIRYVNGAPTSSRHNAVDLAIDEGTPVYAAAAGRVICAQFLQLTGNTILIEHGFGLKTWYYHMVSLNVKEGAMVEQGQKIGEVGTTGFSTGPHLHFGVTVNNVFVNPYTPIETDLLNWME